MLSRDSLNPKEDPLHIQSLQVLNRSYKGNMLIKGSLSQKRKDLHHTQSLQVLNRKYKGNMHIKDSLNLKEKDLNILSILVLSK